MFGTVAEMRNEKRGILLYARGIAEEATKAGRGFTKDERDTVARCIAKTKLLGEEITKADPDAAAARRKADEDALVAQILKFGGGSSGDQMYGGGFQGGGRALKGQAWADAFVKGLRLGEPGSGYHKADGKKDLMAPSGAVGVPGYIAGLTPLGEKVETILQLIPWTTMGGTDAFSYLRETVRTHNAAPVATGTVKPTSVYTVERVDDRVRTIAHLSEAIPKSWLDDITLLQQYLRMVLYEGYELELEDQILSGTGLGESFTGILNTSGIQLVAFVTDVLVTCRKAITALEVLSIPPGAYVFHPGDWETFELMTETTGGYILKDGTRVVPIDRAKRRLWGYPVALSTGIAEGIGLLVDFMGSTQGWEREKVRLDWTEAFHVPAGDYDTATSGFERNQVKFRAEGRTGFAVKRPAGVVKIDLEAGS